MNITLTVVVTAIVILITALVVITIFGAGVANVGSITEARAYCKSQGLVTCKTVNSVPATWDIITVKVNGVPMSCKDATLCPDCDCLIPQSTTPSTNN